MTDVVRLPLGRVEDGADPAGRDTFSVPPGSVLRVCVDGRGWQDLEIEAGTYVGAVTAARVAREQREAAERVEDVRSRREAPDPACSGAQQIYSCGRRRSELVGDETMSWCEAATRWWCSSCEAAYDD